MKGAKDHDPMCPVTAIHPWQICLCEAFALVRQNERQKIELQKERETNEVLKKIITTRDKTLSDFWAREREDAAERISKLQAEYESKRDRGWRCFL